jgi:3-oxoacyl-(acyl-carrier-protein) synthase
LCKLSALSEKISITAIASVSPLGSNPDDIWARYLDGKAYLTQNDFGRGAVYAGFLDGDCRETVGALRAADPKYKPLDPTVLYAMTASRKAVADAGWHGAEFGVNIGSSRGATELFERHHAAFLASGRAETLASPTTTLGNISSWVAHDLQTAGPVISHSITCSTALHALLNGVAWLRSGMADKFLVGGSEAPLTAFTAAQMQAMKIYARGESEFPCRALDFEKKHNTMVLGEAASVCCLEKGAGKNTLAVVEGVGYATEILEHSTSITADAECFQKSMAMALGNTNPSEVDVVVMHAPGTVRGDESEFRAVQKIFDGKMPLLTSNKWKMGHTFGASGMLSIEMAILMMQHQMFIGVPFAGIENVSGPIKKIMVNAVGFGGNAVSVLLDGGF